MRSTPISRIRSAILFGLCPWHRVVGEPSDVEPQVPDPLIAAPDRVDERSERAVCRRVVVAGAGAGEVSDLHLDVRSRRKHLLDERARLALAVRPAFADVGPQMNGRDAAAASVFRGRPVRKPIVARKDARTPSGRRPGSSDLPACKAEPDAH
jgi:hypothetical protein